MTLRNWIGGWWKIAQIVKLVSINEAKKKDKDSAINALAEYVEEVKSGKRQPPDNFILIAGYEESVYVQTHNLTPPEMMGFCQIATANCLRDIGVLD